MKTTTMHQPVTLCPSSFAAPAGRAWGARMPASRPKGMGFSQGIGVTKQAWEPGGTDKMDAPEPFTGSATPAPWSPT